MEKRKLTAKDLMVGDWVKIKEPNKYAGAIGTIQALSSLEGTYFAIYINDPNFGTFVTEVFCEDIEPIPLTAEILEKNGFEKHYDDDIIIYTHPQGIIIEMGINYKLFDDGHFFVRGIQHRLYYVHELQNALRLCSVDKEIVL
jgi:hypothetical protein